MIKLSSIFALVAISSTIFSADALALSRQQVLKCETPKVQQEILANVRAIDTVANGLLARSGDDRLTKKMMEIAQESTSCDGYVAVTNLFLKQVRKDLIQLDQTLTLSK